MIDFKLNKRFDLTFKAYKNENGIKIRLFKGEGMAVILTLNDEKDEEKSEENKVIIIKGEQITSYRI